MINTKKDLIFYLNEDAKANGRNTIKPKFMGDVIWKYIVCLRKTEYFANTKKLIPYYIYKLKLHNYTIKFGFQIPLNVCDYGLSLPHLGTIVISSGAKIGKYCRIHEGVTIGATNGSSEAANIGDRVFIASGAKIIGSVCIPDDCAIGANAVVAKSIDETGSTYGGVPAKKISDNSSHANLFYYG